MKTLIENDYLLLTPGPLSTSPTVRQAMDRDWCTWDEEYNEGVVTPIRQRLVELSTATCPKDYTCVLMQGSGTFSVEAMLGSTIGPTDRLLVLANGVYGNRLAQIADCLRIDHVVHDSGELERPDLDRLDDELTQDESITHVVLVHGETTTGMINPLPPIAAMVKGHGRLLLVDSMSAFGGVPLDIAELGIDYLVSSANKCIQGVPGFGFVIGRKAHLEQTKGWARSLSLDLHAQWQGMEQGHGKWRFTSPTHVVRAFYQALMELEAEGGIAVRHARYSENQRRLVTGMDRLGFDCVLPAEYQGPIITGFHNPTHPDYDFGRFYAMLKEKGFVIYPGSVTGIDSFRIGTIGHVFPNDIDRLLLAIESSMYWA